MDQEPELMPLSRALHVLAETHTRDDSIVGFVVEPYASIGSSASRHSQYDYIEAWRAVRAHLHMQIDPKRLAT